MARGGGADVAAARGYQQLHSVGSACCGASRNCLTQLSPPGRTRDLLRLFCAQLHSAVDRRQPPARRLRSPEPARLLPAPCGARTRAIYRLRAPAVDGLGSTEARAKTRGQYMWAERRSIDCWAGVGALHDVVDTPAAASGARRGAGARLQALRVGPCPAGRPQARVRVAVTSAERLGAGVPLVAGALGCRRGQGGQPADGRQAGGRVQ